MRSKIL